MHIAPNPTLSRTYFFPHQMPLYMRSAYSWCCSHRADGSSVWTRQTLGLQWWPAGLAESWVSRREGSETLPRAGPSCGSAKAKSFRPIPGYNFPLCQAFPPSMLPAPAPFSRLLSCLRVRSSVLVMDHWDLLGWMRPPDLDHRALGGFHSWVPGLCPCHLRSPPEKHNLQ